MALRLKIFVRSNESNSAKITAFKLDGSNFPFFMVLGIYFPIETSYNTQSDIS